MKKIHIFKMMIARIELITTINQTRSTNKSDLTRRQINDTQTFALMKTNKID